MTPFHARSPLARSLVLFAIGLVSVTLCMLQTGCGKATLPPTRSAALAQCDAMCYVPCVDPATKDTGVRWGWELSRVTDPAPAAAPPRKAFADTPEAWDALAGGSADAVVDVLADKLRQCDVARKACVQCLNRLEQQRVIVQ